jgi:hypothetical protein
MGVKFELFLVVLIVATSVYMMSIKLRDHNRKYADSGKEVEFYDTTFTEVNTSGFVSTSYGIHGERINGVLHIESFRYRNNEVRLLVADQAYDDGKKIRLEGNVRAKRYDGFRYKTELAGYDRKTDIMEAYAPFVAYKPPNTLYGETMRYDVKRKELYATNVRAVIKTKKTTDESVNKE